MNPVLVTRTIKQPTTRQTPVHANVIVLARVTVTAIQGSVVKLTEKGG